MKSIARIAQLRALIAQGLSDDEIAEELACEIGEIEKEAATAAHEREMEGKIADAEHEAMYGPEDLATDPRLPTPAYLRDDDYYRRNDAGEYCWM